MGQFLINFAFKVRICHPRPGFTSLAGIHNPPPLCKGKLGGVDRYVLIFALFSLLLTSCVGATPSRTIPGAVSAPTQGQDQTGAVSPTIDEAGAPVAIDPGAGSGQRGGNQDSNQNGGNISALPPGSSSASPSPSTPTGSPSGMGGDQGEGGLAQAPSQGGTQSGSNQQGQGTTWDSSWPGAGPQASIPAPTLRKPLILCSAADVSDNVPCFGTPGSASCGSGATECFVMVSPRDLSRNERRNASWIHSTEAKEMLAMSSPPRVYISGGDPSRLSSPRILPPFVRGDERGVDSWKHDLLELASSNPVTRSVLKAQSWIRWALPLRKGELEGVDPSRILIPLAHAQTTNTCDLLEDVIDCCNVVQTGANAGSFECFLPNASNETTVRVYLCREGGNCSPLTTETPFENVLYTKEAPRDVSVDPTIDLARNFDDKVYVQTSGMVSKIIREEGTFKVDGDFRANYIHVSSRSGNEFVHDGGRVYSRRPSDSIESIASDTILTTEDILEDLIEDELGLDRDARLTVDETLTVSDGVGWAFTETTVDEAETYDVLKRCSDGVVRFGIRSREGDAQRFGKVYRAPVAETDQIQFLVSTDCSSEIVEGECVRLNHSRTLAFDVDSAGFALVAFEDVGGRVRLRVGFGNSTDPAFAIRFGGETPLPVGTYDFKDIQIYHENASSADHGKALILDRLGNRLGVIDFNHRPGAARSVEITDWINLGSGKNPESVVLSPSKRTAYVVNQGDSSVSVLTLTSEGGAVRTATEIQSDVATLSLSTLIPGKTIGLSAGQIDYKALSADDDVLMITSGGLRGNLVWNLSE